MKEEIWILIDKNAGKSVNYIGIHKHKQGAEHHKHFRQLKTRQKDDTLIIRKGIVTFED